MSLVPRPALADALRRPGTTIVVTGAGGWLGRAAIDLLDRVHGPALDQRVAVFGRTARMIALGSGRTIACRALADLPDLQLEAPYLLHFAFHGREKVAELGAAPFIAENRRIGEIVEAYLVRRPVRGLFLPSSGAVYGPARSLPPDLAENPYGAMKFEDEQRYRVLADRLGFPLTLFRVFNLGGPWINKLDGYALATVLRDIRRGGPIVLRAARPVIRSYVHVGDVLQLALADLVAAAGSGPLDTAGERAVEIGDLALLARDLLGAGSLEIQRPPLDPTAPADCYVGDGTLFRALAARHGIVPAGLERQVLDTAADLARRVP